MSTAATQLEKRLRAVEPPVGRKAAGFMIHVPGVGRGLSSAYEQLRKAAEYTEDHLLLERAIRRFLVRNLSFYHQRNMGKIADELVIELTQSGYLTNDTVSDRTVAEITHNIERYMKAYASIRERRITTEMARNWVLDILSAGTADLLDPKPKTAVYAYFAYEHFLNLLPKSELITDPTEAKHYEVSLYVAVHLALLKSDLATIRYDLIKLYGYEPEKISQFVQINLDITAVFYAKLTQRQRRVISKYGAPIRILKRMIEEKPNIADILSDRATFLATFEQQTYAEYRGVRQRLNRRLIKSVVFLIITKGIVGFGIEIPYDLATAGSVALTPLAVNLFFPPIYLTTLRLGLRLPTISNAQALQDYIDKSLYSKEIPVQLSVRSMTRPMSRAAKIKYVFVFFIPFSVTVAVLSMLHFTYVQMVIFFVFLSAASFLGFRLSQTIRELEIVNQEVGFLAAARDFFYLPFIVTGQWLSAKYARVNVVGLFLDVLIELPLKTVLRLIRQWLRFVNERHEQIY